MLFKYKYICIIIFYLFIMNKVIFLGLLLLAQAFS